MIGSYSLSSEGERLLRLLVSMLPKTIPNEPRTYIGYQEVHAALELKLVRKTYGDSLKEQGLSSLAEWTFKTQKPAITGLIINKKTMRPGKGYFSLFLKNVDDFSWWATEIERSKEFDWTPYLRFSLPPMLPLAVDLNEPPGREEVTVCRIIRDSPLARRIKQLHNYECQICGQTILLPGGIRYAEAHHVQPLGAPHNGPDCEGNIICVCPNHHAELDYGARPLQLAALRGVKGHSLNDIYIKYHNEQVWREL